MGGTGTFGGNISGARGFFNSGSTNVVATFTSTDGTAITTFTFDSPVYVQENTEYALALFRRHFRGKRRRLQSDFSNIVRYTQVYARIRPDQIFGNFFSPIETPCFPDFTDPGQDGYRLGQ